MGCVSSKPEAASNAVADSKAKSSSGHHKASSPKHKPRESEIIRQMQADSTPDLLGVHGKNNRPLMSNARSKPQLVNQLKETTAVQLAKGADRGAGVHHLKNVFAAPIEDLTSFQAPVFPKGQAERTFILEALEQNFVFS